MGFCVSNEMLRMFDVFVCERDVFKYCAGKNNILFVEETNNVRKHIPSPCIFFKQSSK